MLYPFLQYTGGFFTFTISSVSLAPAFVTTPTLNRLYQTSLTLAPSLKRLGELYEAKGDQPATGWARELLASLSS